MCVCVHTNLYLSILHANTRDHVDANAAAAELHDQPFVPHMPCMHVEMFLKG